MPARTEFHNKKITKCYLGVEGGLFNFDVSLNQIDLSLDLI